MAGILEFYLMLERQEDEEREVINRRNYLRVYRRKLRDTMDPYDLPENTFRHIFRLSKEGARYLAGAVDGALPPRSRSSAISNERKVLCTLNFLASGSYQRRVGQDVTVPMGQSTVSCAIAEVTRAINETMLNQWVKFPTTRQEKDIIKQRFTEARNFPGVIGCVDGTQIAIVPPTLAQQEHLFMNRKSYHSINVQLICDHNLTILAVNARHPGSHHDQFVWNNSAVSREMRRQYENGDLHSDWLLGDSGYTAAPWLLCPMLDQPDGSPGFNYTKAHCSTRNCIERCIGVLKARFRCLRKDRTLHYSPGRAGQIINACVVVHNIAQHYRLPEPEPLHDEIDQLPPQIPPVRLHADVAQHHNINLYREGLNVRARLIQNRFT